MQRMQQKARRPATLFILLSLLIHVAVVLVLSLKPYVVAPQPERIEVEYTTPPELAPPTDDNAGHNRKKIEVSKNQVVEQQKQLNDERDDKSRFLSAFNQKVVTQTRAERSGKFSNQAMGSKKTEGSKDGDKQSKTAEKEKTKPQEAGELPDLQALKPKFSLNPGEQGPQVDQNGNPSQTDDYIKDVKTGMQTLLSTREFVYYAYYNRIKEALRQHWEPDVREKVKIIYRQGRTIASAKDRVTQVMVILDPTGELIRVEVLGQSGVIDLDNAAVEAFKEAAPFPNPPKGMIEGDGTIKIRWDFVLEV